MMCLSQNNAIRLLCFTIETETISSGLWGDVVGGQGARFGCMRLAAGVGHGGAQASRRWAR